MNKRKRGLLRAFAAGAAVVLVTAGCSVFGDDEPEPAELRVLAGSELADLRPLLEEARKKTGVRVVMSQVGTLDGVQQVVDGKADGRYDAVWFSSNRYLSLHPGAQARLGPAVRTMTSPVVLGLRASVARRLGWDVSPPTWADIADAAGEGRFTYGMTSPAASNSGFSALVGVATALTKDEPGAPALGSGTVADLAPRLRRFFSGQTLTAGSSGWLSDSYVRFATRGQGQQVDGIINYESVLLSLNASGRLPEPLTVVYPRDGVVTADYPLTLLASAPKRARDAHRRLTEYLTGSEGQNRISLLVHRRAVKGPAGPFPDAPPELPFPNRLDTVNALVAAYFDEYRRPSRTLYVLDVSGSMRGDRISRLRSALVGLTGANPSLSGGFQRFHEREEVTLIPFSDRPETPRSATVPEDSPEPVLAQLRSYAEELTVGGQTAVYDSLLRAYEVAREQAARDPDRFTSIVLMTDGENNRGTDLAGFRSRYGDLPGTARAIPVFPILFGEAATHEMSEVASLTGGRTFDARAQSLEAVFKEIRDYQ